MADPQIKYDINANVSGSEQIAALADEMAVLKRSVDSTSESASVIGTLEKALAELAQQQAAITNFRELKKAVDDADTAFLSAQSIAQGLGAELAKTTNATATQRGEFERARSEVLATKQAYQDSVAALAGVRQELVTSGISTQNLGAAQIKLSADVGTTVEQLTQLKIAMANAGAGMGQAKVSAEQTGAALEQAFKVLGVKSVQSVEDEINKLRAAMQVVRQSGSFMSPDSLAAAEALRTKVAALEGELKNLPAVSTPAATGIHNVGSAAEGVQASIANATFKLTSMVAAMAGITSLGDVAKNVITTGASFETLRVRLEQLLGSQQKATQAFDMIKQLAIDTPFEVTNLTEAFARLTSFGLQPNVAQMRALADTAAAAGGGQQMLERVSLALGQAWAKQKLQGQEIMQLTEAGIPVWDLLAKATGRNVTELNHMSESGALGRDVILKLWEAMGENSAGASERLMHTFAGTISNAKDAMAEFFDMISRSGVLEYLTKEVQNVLNEFDRLKNNGQLEEKAKAISNAVTGTIDVLKNAIEIVSKFSGAIGHLLEAMVVKNIIAFGVNLAGLGVAGFSAAAGVGAAGVSIGAAGATAATASIGVRAFGAALTFLKAAVPFGALLVGLDFLVGKFFDAKRAAEEGDAKVAAMLNDKGTGAAAKAVDDIAASAAESKSVVDKLKLTLDSVVGAGLLSQLKDFSDKMRLIRADTKDTQDGLAAIGLQAAKSLGVDTAAAANKVAFSFQDSNAALTAMISTFPNMAKAGLNAAAIVGTAVEKMIDGAKTQAELDIINKRLIELGQRGYQSGAEVAAGMKLAQDKGDELKLAIATWGLGFADVSKAAGKAGVDIGELTTGVSKSFKNSVTDVDNLAAAIKATGIAAKLAEPQLSKALDQRLQAAQTTQEIQLVIAEYKKLGEQGLLTGDNLKDGLQKGMDKLDAMTKGVNSLAEAYHQLGLKTPEELKKIAEANSAAWDKVKGDSSATLETLKTAFETYAQSAIAASGEVGSAQRQTTEEVLRQEAALKGLTVGFDDNGKVVVQTQRDCAAAIAKTTDGLNSQKNAVDKVTSALEAENAAIERANAAQEKSISLENKRLHRDANGFATDDAGNTIVAGGELTTATGIMNFLKSAGVDDEATAKATTREFLDTKGQVIYMDNPGQLKYGGDTISMALLHAAEQYTMMGGKERVQANATFNKKKQEDAAKTGTLAPAGTTPAGTTPAGSAPTVLVTGAPQGNAPVNNASTTGANGTAQDSAAAAADSSTASKSAAVASAVITHRIVLGNRSTDVNVASVGDSQNLTSVIQQLTAARLSANG